MFFKSITLKGVSPLIATILLVVVSVILVTVVLTWGKDFTSESLNETKDVFKDSSLTGFIKYERTLGNVVVVRNYHQTESTTITDYEIVSLGDNFWLNSKTALLNNLELFPGRSVSIDLGCVPEDSFILSLYTTDNKIISINVPSSAQGLNNCSSYSLPIESLLNNVVSGSFEINELTGITSGELLRNNRFEDTSVWNRQTTGGEQAEIIDNKLRMFQTTENTSYVNQNFIITPNLNNWIKVKYKILNNTLLGSDTFRMTSTSFIGFPFGLPDSVGEHTIYFQNLNPTSTNHIRMFISANVGADPLNNYIELDYFYAEEVKTPNLENGVKYLEITSSGTTAIKSNLAYGTWEFDIYNSDKNNIVSFIKDRPSGSYRDFIGYNFNWLSTNAVRLRSHVVGNHTDIISADNSLNFNTWYRIKITRTQNGEFSLFAKGGQYNDWTLLGTNTNTTHTTSEYFSFSGVYSTIGNRIKNVVFKDYVE